MLQKHKRNFSTASFWGQDGGGGDKRIDMTLAWRENEGWKHFLQSLQLVTWPALRFERRQEAGGQRNKESVWKSRAWQHLAGLSAQLLPVGRLILLWFRAGVGAPVEGRHRAAFAVCVKAAVRRVVCLAVPFGLLECTNCESSRT